MGLPGSGKTTLAKKVVKLLKADWLNADKIRGKHNDWDFSKEGIIMQVKRMKNLAKKSKKKICSCRLRLSNTRTNENF